MRYKYCRCRRRHGGGDVGGGMECEKLFQSADQPITVAAKETSFRL